MLNKELLLCQTTNTEDSWYAPFESGEVSVGVVLFHAPDTPHDLRDIYNGNGEDLYDIATSEVTSAFVYGMYATLIGVKLRGFTSLDDVGGEVTMRFYASGYTKDFNATHAHIEWYPADLVKPKILFGNGTITVTFTGALASLARTY